MTSIRTLDPKRMVDGNADKVKDLIKKKLNIKLDSPPEPVPQPDIDVKPRMELVSDKSTCTNIPLLPIRESSELQFPPSPSSTVDKTPQLQLQHKTVKSTTSTTISQGQKSKSNSKLKWLLILIQLLSMAIIAIISAIFVKFRSLLDVNIDTIDYASSPISSVIGIFEKYLYYYKSLETSNYGASLYTELFLFIMITVQLYLDSFNFISLCFISAIQIINAGICYDFATTKISDLIDNWNSLFVMDFLPVKIVSISNIVNDINDNRSMFIKAEIAFVVLAAARFVAVLLFVVMNCLGKSVRDFKTTFIDSLYPSLFFVPCTLMASILVKSDIDTSFYLQIIGIVIFLTTSFINWRFEFWLLRLPCALIYFLLIALISFKLNHLKDGFYILTPRIFLFTGVCAIIFLVITIAVNFGIILLEKGDTSDNMKVIKEKQSAITDGGLVLQETV